MSAGPPEAARWERCPDVLVRATPHVVVLKAVTCPEVVTLELTAREVWEALRAPRSVPELAEELGSVYGVPSEAVAADVGPVLDSLAARGLVRRAGRAAA